MGAAAGCDFYKKIIQFSPAKNDQEHIHVILDSNAQIPDRTAYILDVEKQKLIDGTFNLEGAAPIIPELLEKHEMSSSPSASPLPEMLSSAKMLESLGCEAICMACVTGHYFEEEIKNSINIPFISITEAAVDTLRKKDVNAAAVLGTDGSLCAQIFRTHLEKYNISPVYPNMEEQKLLMDLIYKYVKHGNLSKVNQDYDNVMAMLDHLRAQGAQAFILGCTEVPIAFEALKISGEDIIDSTVELAKAMVEFAVGGTYENC